MLLNACEGARASLNDPFSGAAQSLVLKGIPAVIAMQFEVSDEAAIALASGFYAALADDYPVDAALTEARKAVFAAGCAVEWGTPVLYLRAADGRIFDVKRTEAQKVEPAAPLRPSPSAMPPPRPPAVTTGIDKREVNAGPVVSPQRPPVITQPEPARRPEPEKIAAPSGTRIAPRWVVGLAIIAIIGVAVWITSQRQKEESVPTHVATSPTPIAIQTPTASVAETQTAQSSQSDSSSGYDPAIAFVDMNRIFKEFNKTKDAEAKINDAKNSAKKEYDDRAAAYSRALDEINVLNGQLDSLGSSSTAYATKAREREEKIAKIKEMEKQINDFSQRREKELQDQALKMREGIVKQMTDEISLLGGDVCNIIFDKSGMSLNGVPIMMYSPDVMDMSNNVVSAVNSQSSSAGTKFTASHELKFAAIDMNRAFKEYNKTKDAEAKINEAKNVAKQEYDGRANDYKKALDEINKLNQQLDAPALSADAKTAKAKERDEKISSIKTMEREINEFRQTRERQLQEQALRMREGIVKEITDVAMDDIRENKIDVVLDTSGRSLKDEVPIVLFHKNGIPDFTEQVVAVLNHSAQGSNALTSVESSRSLRFGLVDMNRVLKGLPETKEAEAKIEAEKAAAQREYANKSAAERDKREKELQEDAKKLREPIVAKILSAAKTCAERSRFDLVFDSSGMSLNGVPFVLLTHELPDLSEAVLQECARLNNSKP